MTLAELQDQIEAILDNGELMPKSIRMSNAQLQFFSIGAILAGDAPHPIPAAGLICRMYGIPIEIDDNLEKPVLVY